MVDRPARKNKDIPKDIQPTDIDEKVTALLRRNASSIRTRDRIQQQVASSPQQQPPTRSPRPPQPPIQRRANNLHEADYNDFSRRLRISSSPTPHHRTSTKLFDPHSDPISLRRTAEPEAMSDDTSNSLPPHLHSSPPNHASRDRERDSKEAPTRQLFDHRKDDPVRFSVLARPNRDRPTPTPKSSADYVSASSTSSYANSMASSTFTLSSTTDGSSASSALFERSGSGGGGRGDDSGNVFSIQLKKLYRAITNLETKVKMEDADENDGEEEAPAMRIEPRITLKGKGVETSAPLTEEDIEREKWKAQIQNHKQLAEFIHNLLEISLSPSVPASLRNIPTKYNIIVRLWTYGFHKLLKSLHRASFSSSLALEHLQDFIYYAYTFYTGLLEEPTLLEFKSKWLEALGDLARYRMAVAAMVGGVGSTMAPGRKLTLKEVRDATAMEDTADDNDKLKPPNVSKESTSDGRKARIDDSPSPSVGIVAARLLELEPETELWRGIARDWYGLGLAEQPGNGKLHHHLGLLSRDVVGEELKGVYHFVKSMTTLHPFTTSRESVLPIWSVSNQSRRMSPETPASGLFVLLHGMLFTHIQLDDFIPTLARFIERLSIDELEEREWTMMGIINIAAIFEYGRPASVLGRIGGREGTGMPTPIVMTKPSATHTGDVADENLPKARTGHTNQMSPANSEAETDDVLALNLPPSFNYALQLAFSMLSYALRHPTLTTPDSFTRPNPNPYLTIMLTFLATVPKNPRALSVLERNVPWEELANFFSTQLPERIMKKQGLIIDEKRRGRDKETGSRWVLLTSGCAPPLPEDWCMRGMEWVGRSVFERGYWKSGEERRAEIEVLEEREVPNETTDGRIEDDTEDETATGKSGNDGNHDAITKRWLRIVRSAIGISSLVEGLSWVEASREWKVEGPLSEKVVRWQEQGRIEQEEAERRRLGTRWSDDYMDVDDETLDLSEEDENSEDDTPEVKELKARRKYLQSFLQSASHGTAFHPPSPPRRPRASSKRSTSALPSFRIIPGYSIIVVDTNILLSSLPMFASVIESLRWTIVIPLPVITELDGLSLNASAQLSEAAQNAVTYVSSHVRSHAASLKVQTTKGNYLTNLNIRTENIDFATGGNGERNMDDLILKIAIWQEEHWIDRTAILKADLPVPPVSDAAKVVLLSLDRNLRLKARSRQLCTASERDLAEVLAKAA